VPQTRRCWDGRWRRYHLRRFARIRIFKNYSHGRGLHPSVHSELVLSLQPTTSRPKDPLYKKMRVVGLWSAITLIRRCRPVGGLDGSFELQCLSITHHSKANVLIQRVRGPRSTVTYPTRSAYFELKCGQVQPPVARHVEKSLRSGQFTNQGLSMLAGTDG